MIPPDNIFKVAIICGSTRTPRVGPQVTDYVFETIKSNLATSSPIQIEVVDIAHFNLPLFDEPIIPQAVSDPSGYTHQHTRAWSARISSCDAFVFVTPQYNWGIPAALKNAIDFLFNEWKGKPAMIVSYGGHGGGKAAEALKTVCQGLKMKVMEKTVALAFPDKEFMGKCLAGGDLGLELDRRDFWTKESEEIRSIWDEMAGQLVTPV